MTISNARFDRIAARRDKLERRSENIEFKLDLMEERLEDLDPITDYKKIERIQNRIDRFNDRLDLANTRIDNLTERLPQDEFEISYNDNGEFDIKVTDSPYDDTYVGGTPLKFSVLGVRQTDKGTQRRTTSIGIESFEDEAGSTFAGSGSFENIVSDYPEVVATLYDENNNALASTEIF